MHEEAEYETTIYGLRIFVNKVGGGTLGREYDGDWEVTVMNGDVYVFDNDSLYSATPRTHVDTAHTAYEYAAAEIDGSWNLM